MEDTEERILESIKRRATELDAASSAIHIALYHSRSNDLSPSYAAQAFQSMSVAYHNASSQ